MTQTRIMNRNEEEPLEEEISYCRYCKYEINDLDERVIKEYGEYHKECWLQKNNKIQELDFS